MKKITKKCKKPLQYQGFCDTMLSSDIHHTNYERLGFKNEQSSIG